jgi:hypothetical protein
MTINADRHYNVTSHQGRAAGAPASLSDVDEFPRPSGAEA